jgi:cytochrome c-type biogenesis protein CcmF
LRKKISANQIAMLLGHISYAVLTLSITLNSLLEREVDLIGAPNTNVQLADLQITLQDIKYSYGANYLRQIAVLNISDPKQASNIILRPENRWYVIENKMTAKSSIYSFLTYDMYAVLNRITDNKAHIKIYYRPYISFIWLAGLCLALSFLISTAQKHKSKACKL